MPISGRGRSAPPHIPSGKRGDDIAKKNDVQVHSATMHLSSNVSLSCVLGWRCIAAGTKGCVCGGGRGQDCVCYLYQMKSRWMEFFFQPGCRRCRSCLFSSLLCVFSRSFPFSVISGTTPVYRGGRVPSELTTPIITQLLNWFN